tara:strand:- start:97 stop:1422 length:1326 start_codon:yes stop_codon:yes gene_type:complete
MASLNDAYARVREQTESNNAEKEEGYGIFQGAFQNILSTVNKDLDPNNITKPLSPIGSALDSVLGFREKQIKNAAKNSARLSQAEYDALGPQRVQSNADKLKNDLYREAEINKARAKQSIENIYPSLNSGYGGIDTASHIRKIIDNDASLAPTILAAYKNKDMFRVFDKDYVAQVKDGTKIHTDSDGKQLFATGNSKVININKAHNRLTREFNTALEEEGFITEQDKALLRDTSIAGREKLFSDRRFQNALDRSVKYLTPEMLEGHELYAKHLGAKFKEINTKLERDTNFYISRGKTLQTEAAYLARQVSSMDTPDIKETERLYTAKIEEIKANAKLTNRLQLNHQFQTKVQLVIYRRAYAQSLITGTQSTDAQAKQNINNAILFTRNDPALTEYVRQLNAFYGDNPGDISSASTTINPPSKDEKKPRATPIPVQLATPKT